MIIKVLQSSDSHRHKLRKYGGYLLYQEYWDRTFYCCRTASSGW